MAKEAKIFPSFSAHEKEDSRFYRELGSAERLKIWLQLCRFDRNDAPGKRLKRVYRIAPLRKG
jgi:hypothetical protein